MKRTLSFSFAKPAAFFISVLLVQYSFAQIIDSSFGVNGKQTFNVQDDEVFTKSLVYQGDKILASVWDVDVDQYFPITYVFRLNADGSIDSSFNIQINSLRQGYVAVQKDKKVLVTGEISDRSENDPLGTVAIYRFLPNGEPDNNFGVNGRYATLLPHRSSINEIVVKNDGRILAAGFLQAQDKLIALFQVNKDGSLDTTFGDKGFIYTTTPYEGTCYALKLMQDGKILTGCLYKIDKKAFGTCLVRYTTAGKIDSSFGVNGVVINGNRIKSQSEQSPLDISLTTNDKIVVFASDSTAQGIICRYKRNGEPDSSFGDNGKVTGIYHNHYRNFFVNTDSVNKILISRSQFGKNAITSLARYKVNGTPDSSFGVDGVIPTDSISNELLITPNKKLLVLGISSYYIYAKPTVVKYKFGTKTITKESDTALLKSQPKYSTANNIITVYPNPAKNMLHISGLDDKTNYTLYIVDAKGNIFISKQTIGNCDLNIEELKPGIYYLNAVSNRETVTGRFIKE